MSKRIVVLIGMSGSGKTTLIDHVVAQCPNVQRVMSFTTRPREPRDLDGTYEFISREDFERRDRAGTIVQSDTYNGNIYGNDQSQFALPEGAIGILAMTEPGARALIALGYNVRIVKVIGIGARIREGRQTADLGRIDALVADQTVFNDFGANGLGRAVHELASYIATAF